MHRKEFIKHACGLGLCSCTVAALVASADETTPDAPAEHKPDDERITFARQRYATLLAALGRRSDAATTTAVLEDVGRSCASSAPFLQQYAGNVVGFIADIRARWHADVAYDAEHGVVDLAFPPSGECYCPLLSKATSPAIACACSIGWQKQAFETVFGRAVTAELTESVLRGGSHCSFRIRAS